MPQPYSSDLSRGTRLRTEISRAFWCNPKSNYAFEPASLPAVMRGDPKNGTCWFDELFEGGIILPRGDAGENRALTILLTGPPGTGKSTLATELCFRSALSSEIKPDGLRSLYLTLEAHKPWLIENVNSFGWQGAASVFAAQAEEPPRVQIIPVKNESDLAQWASNDPAPPTNVISKTASLLGLKLPDVPTVGIGSVKVDAREILVVDSLNTIRGDRLDLFDCLMSLVSSGPKIIILILDSFPDRGPQVWDFSADIVIRLDRDYSSGYLIRTLEVEKARYQSHVWGKHQLKIYEQYKHERRSGGAEDKIRDLRAHPYRQEGGVFIFPSIHYVLSRYKAKSPSESSKPIPCPIENLTEVLGGGLPRGRCIGLVGERGTHKSHFGYMQVLSCLLGPPSHPGENSKDRALIVSLRDDEGMTRQTLKKILVDHWKRSPSDLESLESQGRLEITYFPPGFITPEEFFHRLLLSINLLKSGIADAHITVLFNSLDQLSSRFPLCAGQGIFVPGIIQMLSAEGATSIFVAAHEGKIDPQYYGLLSMAELILSLERKEFNRREYIQWIKQWIKPGLDGYLSDPNDDEKVTLVQLEVDRFAGGQPAGRRGILELVKESDPIFKWSGQAGLIFVPCEYKETDKMPGKTLTTGRKPKQRSAHASGSA